MKKYTYDEITAYLKARCNRDIYANELLLIAINKGFVKFTDGLYTIPVRPSKEKDSK